MSSLQIIKISRFSNSYIYLGQSSNHKIFEIYHKWVTEGPAWYIPWVIIINQKQSFCPEIENCAKLPVSQFLTPFIRFASLLVCAKSRIYTNDKHMCTYPIAKPSWPVVCVFFCLNFCFVYLYKEIGINVIICVNTTLKRWFSW